MNRKGYYNRHEDEPLYGLVPLDKDRSILEGIPPTPLRVFQCGQCGSIALFSQDHENDWGNDCKS